MPNDVPPLQTPPAGEKPSEFDRRFERLYATLDEDPQEGGRIVEEIEREIRADKNAPPDLSKQFLIFCRGLRSLYLGRSEMHRNMIPDAQKRFAEAESALGADEDLSRFRDLAAAHRLYAEAVALCRLGNVGKALELFEETLKFGDGPGAIPPLRSLVDLLKPEYFWLLAQRDMALSDQGGAQAHLSQASTASEYLSKQAQQGSPAQHQLHGMALYYQAYAQFLRLVAQYHQFAFDALVHEPNLTQTASEARACLEKVGGGGELLAAQIAMCRFFESLLLSYQAIAALMHKILRSTFKPAEQDLNPVKEKIREARNLAAKVPEQKLLLDRLCDQLDGQVRNLETLAKPTAADFGIYGGLISCAIFAALLFLSYVATRFGIPLDGAQLVNLGYVCAVLAVAAGFGSAGLKYIVPYFFPGAGAKGGK